MEPQIQLQVANDDLSLLQALHALLSGNLDDAEAGARELLQRHKDLTAVFILANCYERRNLHSAAIDLYQTLVHDQQWKTFAYRALGRIYEKQLDFASARYYLDQAIQIHPEWLSLKHLANLLQSTGQSAEAVKVYEQASEMIPESDLMARFQLDAARIMSLYCLPEVSNQGVWHEIQTFAATYQALLPPTPGPVIPGPRAYPLRLGYVTPDACNHSAGRLLHEFLLHLW